MQNMLVAQQKIKDLYSENAKLRFALENLRRIHRGEGGTAKIDLATGLPLICSDCGQVIYYGHSCASDQGTFDPADQTSRFYDDKILE